MDLPLTSCVTLSQPLGMAMDGPSQGFCKDQMSSWVGTLFAICGVLNNGKELYGKGLGPCGWEGHVGLDGRGSVAAAGGGELLRVAKQRGAGRASLAVASPHLFTTHHRSPPVSFPFYTSPRRCWPLTLRSGPAVLEIIFRSLSFSVDTSDSWQLTQQLVGRLL